MAVSKIDPTGSLEYNKGLGTNVTFELYRAMSEIVIHSAKTFIQDDFEIVVFGDNVNNYREIFHKNFKNLYDTFHSNGGPHSILFLDCDTLVISPVQVFSVFDKFQLFNYTDPKAMGGARAINKYGLQFNHYFNSGVRYFHSSMSKEIWDLGWSYAKDWDLNDWDTEQVIYNQMMYSQDSNYQTWLRPEMNFQALSVPFDKIDSPDIQQRLQHWNGINMNDAKIIHLAGTRGAVNTLLTQWVVWKKITGEEFEFSKVKIVKNENGDPINVSLIDKI
jgi:hypothetical protein